jgi:hypothetical protein
MKLVREAILVFALVGCTSATSTTTPEGSAPSPQPTADPNLPGDAPSGTSPSMQVVINGETRVFDASGLAASYDANGVQVRGISVNGWQLNIMLSGHEPGTYDCTDASYHADHSGFFLDKTTDDKTIGYTPPRSCSVTLTASGDRAGDHVVGTFRAELDLDRGSWPLAHLSLAEGKFDLVKTRDDSVEVVEGN